jgi:hypothetical protein
MGCWHFLTLECVTRGSILVKTEANMNRHILPVCLASAALLLLAPLDWPYGYYQFLRITIAITAIWLACQVHESSQGYALVLTLVAILYNPILPIYLDKDVWLPINLGTGIFYILFAVRVSRANPPNVIKY